MTSDSAIYCDNYNIKIEISLQVHNWFYKNFKLFNYCCLSVSHSSIFLSIRFLEFRFLSRSVADLSASGVIHLVLGRSRLVLCTLILGQMLVSTTKNGKTPFISFFIVNFLEVPGCSTCCMLLEKTKVPTIYHNHNIETLWLSCQKRKAKTICGLPIRYLTTFTKTRNGQCVVWYSAKFLTNYINSLFNSIKVHSLPSFYP